MNYLRAHAAAKKRVKARRDILGLLKNGPKRRRKNKNKSPFVQRPFGIFGRAISFKVILGNATQSNDGPSQRNPDEIVVIPIDRVRIQKPLKEKKKLQLPAKTSQRQHEVTENVNKPNAHPTQSDKDQNKKNCNQSVEKDFVSADFNRHNAVPSQNIFDFDAASQNTHNEATSINAWANRDTIGHIEKDQFAIADLTPGVDNNGSDGYRTPVDRNFGATVRKERTPLEILSFDSLIESDLDDVTRNLSSSIDFSRIENYVEASKPADRTAFTNFSTIKSDFFNTSKTLVNSHGNSSKKSTNSGWSLNTPDFADRSNSYPNDALLTFEPTKEKHINIKSSYDDPTPTMEQSNWSDFESQPMKPSQSQLADDKPKFTMEMLMQRKALAARRALARLFPSPSNSMADQGQSQCQSQSASKYLTNNTLSSCNTSAFKKFTEPTTFISHHATNLPSMSKLEDRSKEQFQLTNKTDFERKFQAPSNTINQIFRKKADLSNMVQSNANHPQIVCSTNNNQLRAQRPKDFKRIPWCGDRTFLGQIVR